MVTVTGEAVREPGNFEVLIGTPIQHLLETAGMSQERLDRLILGGPPMMGGYTLTTDSVPVVKTTNCVIAATAAELPAPPPEQPCIRCGQCAEACPPMELLPQQLFWYSKAGEFEKAEHLNCSTASNAEPVPTSAPPAPSLWSSTIGLPKARFALSARNS